MATFPIRRSLGILGGLILALAAALPAAAAEIEIPVLTPRLETLDTEFRLPNGKDMTVHLELGYDEKGRVAGGGVCVVDEMAVEVKGRVKWKRSGLTYSLKLKGIETKLRARIRGALRDGEHTENDLRYRGPGGKIRLSGAAVTLGTRTPRAYLFFVPVIRPDGRFEDPAYLCSGLRGNGEDLVEGAVEGRLRGPSLSFAVKVGREKILFTGTRGGAGFVGTLKVKAAPEKRTRTGFAVPDLSSDEPPRMMAAALPDAEKIGYLTKHAPRVWLHSAEPYRPSSVEFAFDHLDRYRASDGNWWLRTKDGMPEPSSLLPFFYGQDPDEAPVYAYWVRKLVPADGEVAEVVDLVYFFFYPYNRGKSKVNTVWGNHVGDWEHVTVRLGWHPKGDTGWELRPDFLYVSAHNFGGVYAWDEVEHTADGDHPVVYSAWGSHGCWVRAGSHTYESHWLLGDFTDHCNAGTAWDTWESVEAFDYSRKKGLGTSVWPRWMSTDYTDPGSGDPSDPAAGPVWRWGNVERGGPYFGWYRLESGPTGPAAKGVWGPDLR